MNFADVVFMIECSAINGAYLHELKANYVLPTLEQFSPSMAEGEYLFSERHATQYGIVIYRTPANMLESICSAFGPYTSPQTVLDIFETYPLTGGCMESSANAAEALASALCFFDDLTTLRAQRTNEAVHVQRFAILLCNSPPCVLPVMDCRKYKGKNVEQLASIYYDTKIHLNIIAPRKIPTLIALFKKANGDQPTGKNYAKNIRHLVLLKGYSLNERPSSPNGNSINMQQNQMVASNQQQQQQQMQNAMAVEAHANDNSQQQQQQQQQNIVPNSQHMQPQQQQQQQEQFPVQTQAQQNMPNPNFPNQMNPQNNWQFAAAAQQQQAAAMQPRQPFIATGAPVAAMSNVAHNVPPQNNNSALISQLSAPPSSVANNMLPQQQQQQMRMQMANQQQQQQQQQQTHNPQSAADMNMPANVSMPGGMPHNPVQQQQQQVATANNLNNEQSASRAKIWTGIIEWMEKSKSDQQKITHALQCSITCNIKDGEPEIKADNWPPKLLMQLMPKHLVGNIGGQFLKESKMVIFRPVACEALESLAKVMTTGFAGCVHFPQSPNCDLKVLILLYTADKNAYLGFIPNNQLTFVDRLRQVIAARQQTASGNMPQQQPQQQMQGPMAGGGPPMSSQMAANVMAQQQEHQQQQQQQHYRYAQQGNMPMGAMLSGVEQGMAIQMNAHPGANSMQQHHQMTMLQQQQQQQGMPPVVGNPQHPRMVRPLMNNNPGLRHLLQQQPAPRNQFRPQMGPGGGGPPPVGGRAFDEGGFDYM